MSTIYKNGKFYGEPSASVRYYDNPQDYYDLPVEVRESMTELVILNDNDNPLDASNITYGDSDVASELDSLNSTMNKTVKTEGWNGIIVNRVECDPQNNFLYAFLSDGTYRWFSDAHEVATKIKSTGWNDLHIREIEYDEVGDLMYVYTEKGYLWFRPLGKSW